MNKTIIYSDKAPSPIGSYSQGIMVGNTLFISGQIAFDPATGELITNDISDETDQVMKNLWAILNAAGMDFSHVVKCSIFVKDMGYFETINTIYGKYFHENPPARETVEVSGLPKNVNVEISCIAVKE
ncbi:MAG TPA: reactive intermediate/imine deaminase [Cytophagales bacterium]|jgi:2-iminobutanoate/2-iminopropanoate deaminase|nr:reactive intermediate/imine deaminase [Cytophagales bacterium]